MKTVCKACGKGIIHRPNVPEPSDKVCIACAMLQMEAEQATKN